jgi:hypothetical protein
MKLVMGVSVFLMCIAIATTLSSAGHFAQQALPSVSAASFSPIRQDAEYSNGTIHESSCDIWYDWVNASGTQIIYYVLYSNVVNSPIINFLGQHFHVENDTEVFVGSTMALLEVYNDTNGDGIPQANFTSGVSEIKYYLLMNSSVSYQIGFIHKTLEGGVSHYEWSFKYIMIDGFLLYPEQQPGHAAAKVMVDHLGFSYDFYVDQNVSNLKTSFDIGNITDLQPLPDEPQISLDGLSLSLLFSTSTVAAKPHTVHVNGQQYNSTTTTNSAIAATMGQVAVDMKRAYDFVLGGTYNLTRGQNVETHEVKSEVAATSSVPQSALSDLEWTLRLFEDNLNLTALFGAPWETINLNCNSSALLYRVCYPVWDGLRIEHDPTYVAYLFSSIQIPEFPTPMVLLMFVSAASLTIAWKRLRKRRFIPMQVQ